MAVSKKTKLYNFIKGKVWLLWLPLFFFLGYSLNFHFNFKKILVLQAETLSVKISAENAYERVIQIEKKYQQRVQKMMRESVKMRKCTKILTKEYEHGRGKQGNFIGKARSRPGNQVHAGGQHGLQYDLSNIGKLQGQTGQQKRKN